MQCLEHINTDGKNIYKNKSWLQKFKHYTKTVHAVEIGLVKKKKWSKKFWLEKWENLEQDFLWAVCPEGVHKFRGAENCIDPEWEKKQRTYQGLVQQKNHNCHN